VVTLRVVINSTLMVFTVPHGAPSVTSIAILDSPHVTQLEPNTLATLHPEPSRRSQSVANRTTFRSILTPALHH
jgi:hypothetical protein